MATRPLADVPTRFLLCPDDRFLLADFQRQVVRERLGIIPTRWNPATVPALARPQELDAYWSALE